MRNKKYRAALLPIVLLVCCIIDVVCLVLVADTTTKRVFLIVGGVLLLAVAIFFWLGYVEITDDSIIQGIGGIFSKGRITQQIKIADIEQIYMTEKNRAIIIKFKTYSPAAKKTQQRWAFSTMINLRALDISKRDREAIAVLVMVIAKKIKANAD